LWIFAKQSIINWGLPVLLFSAATVGSNVCYLMLPESLLGGSVLGALSDKSSLHILFILSATVPPPLLPPPACIPAHEPAVRTVCTSLTSCVSLSATSPCIPSH
jgi:hypothetical protein